MANTTELVGKQHRAVTITDLQVKGAVNQEIGQRTASFLTKNVDKPRFLNSYIS
jgi:hypothetical protein